MHYWINTTLSVSVSLPFFNSLTVSLLFLFPSLSLSVSPSLVFLVYCAPLLSSPHALFFLLLFYFFFIFFITTFQAFLFTVQVSSPSFSSSLYTTLLLALPFCSSRTAFPLHRLRFLPSAPFAPSSSESTTSVILFFASCISPFSLQRPLIHPAGPLD